MSDAVLYVFIVFFSDLFFFFFFFSSRRRHTRSTRDWSSDVCSSDLLRFKADEAAQAITGPYRELHPEDNNERQAIHEHDNVALTAAPQKKPPSAKVSAAKAAKVKAAEKVAVSENANPGGN